ncbi:MAG: HTTM domain-containing protein [Actinomycetota bacterium]
MPTATPAPDRRDEVTVAGLGPTPSTAWPARLRTAAGRSVPADSVAAFRIAFGLLAAAGSIRFLARGWVDTLYLEPANHLTYPWLGWVQPWPAPLMHLHVAALAVLGLCVAAGYRTRLAAALFVVGFAWTEAIDAALYLNHYWFLTLAAVLIALLPTGHHWSIDAVTGRVPARPGVAAGVVWALRAQLAVVYAFAGVAKLNGDWLLLAQPLRLWLADRTAVPVVGPLLDEPVVAYAASWGGALFDLTIVGWLLWRRSRPLAWAAVVTFHLVTGALFPIGLFPLVMILGTLIFFPADWPSRLADRLGRRPRLERSSAPSDGVAGPRAVSSPLAIGALSVLAVVQLALPLRHYANDGNVRWTEEGYHLAWRVMLTDKAGHVGYEITDPATGERFLAHPDLVLTDWQANAAAIRPDLIHATAHLLAEHYAGLGRPGVEVRADAWVSMNGRPRQRLVDQTIDLAAHDRGRMPAGWILDPDPTGG